MSSEVYVALKWMTTLGGNMFSERNQTSNHKIDLDLQTNQ